MSKAPHCVKKKEVKKLLKEAAKKDRKEDNKLYKRKSAK